MTRKSINHRRKAWVPSAVPFFLIGLAYYMISPALVLKFLSTDSDLLYVATRYVGSEFFDIKYFVDTIIIFLSFWLGFNLASSGPRAKPSVLDYGSFQTSAPRILAGMFCALIVYFAAIAVMSGVSFFSGYATYDISILGPLSTCAFMSAWFVNYFEKKEIVLLFFSMFVFCALLLLGWGSRMFFILGFMALIIGFVSKNRRLLKSVWFFGAIIGVFLLMAVVGIVREGGREFSGENLIAFLFAEPLFTSISAALYLENSGGRPVYAIPYDLFASVIHFVPSAVFPGKVDLISELTIDDNVSSPFGAKALIVTLYANFGFFYPIFVTALGLYCGFLFKRAQKSIFYRATYFSVLPILLLLFFRETLPTVIKVLIFNGLAVPFVVALFLVWISPATVGEIRRKLALDKTRADAEPRNRGIAASRGLRS